MSDRELDEWQAASFKSIAEQTGQPTVSEPEDPGASDYADYLKSQIQPGGSADLRVVTGEPENPRGWIDWADFWAKERGDEPEYVWHNLIPVGASVALVAPRGDGKSLLTLEGATAVATGGTFLGVKVTQRTVMYVDLDQSESTIHDRLTDLGYTEDDDLSRFHYSLLGDWPPLDTAHGGIALLQEAQRVGAELVIVDTLSRMISGPENENDTFLKLNQFTTRRFQAANISILRLDNTGKDTTKGQRGASAKEDDGEMIYFLRDLGADQLEIKRTKNRCGLQSDETVMITRQGMPLRHMPIRATDSIGNRVLEVIRWMDDLGLPNDTGRPKASKALKDNGHSARNRIIGQAVGVRKTRMDLGI